MQIWLQNFKNLPLVQESEKYVKKCIFIYFLLEYVNLGCI